MPGLAGAALIFAIFLLVGALKYRRLSKRRSRPNPHSSIFDRLQVSPETARKRWYTASVGGGLVLIGLLGAWIAPGAFPGSLGHEIALADIGLAVLMAIVTVILLVIRS